MTSAELRPAMPETVSVAMAEIFGCGQEPIADLQHPARREQERASRIPAPAPVRRRTDEEGPEPHANGSISGGRLRSGPVHAVTLASGSSRNREPPWRSRRGRLVAPRAAGTNAAYPDTGRPLRKLATRQSG